MKKFKGFDKHLRYFIMLTMLIFMVSGIGYTAMLYNKVTLSIGINELPVSVIHLGIFVSLAMLLMGNYYLKALQNK